MSISKTESNRIDEAAQVSEEDVREILENYPGAAIQLAVKNNCLPAILQRFVEIVEEHTEMKSVLNHLLDLIDEENKDLTGELSIDSEHILYKRMAESIGDKERVEKWKKSHRTKK